MSDDFAERLARLEKLAEKAFALPEPQRARGVSGLVAGVGALPEWVKGNDKLSSKLKTGLGDTPDASSPLYVDVWELLAIGSPKLALARALGSTFVPFVINVRGDFTSTDQTLVPETGSDVKIVQDTLVDAAVVTITNQSNTANLSVFQPQSDYFFNVQSGIEATLSVQGGPRYTVAEKFVPLANLFDTPQRPGLWPRKWVLTYQQQFFMAFQATVTLPYAPLEVCVSWRAWVPQGDAYTDLTNRDALDLLASNCGVVVSDAYRSRILGNV